MARLAKMLFLAKDDLGATAERTGSETLIVLAKSAGASYETVANILLAIKNSKPQVIRKLQTENLKQFKHIIFATQALLSAAGSLDSEFADYIREPTESPEFEFKAHFEKVIDALTDLKRSLPHIIPNAGTFMQLVSSIIVQLSVVTEPRYEERPLFASQLV